MNWLAILCAGAAYWVLGSLWYSKLFSKPWSSAIEQYGIKVREPSKAELATKMILTFVANLIAAVVLARLLDRIGMPATMNALRGLKIGAALGIAFSATAITINYVWRTPPLKLWAIDVSYHIVACAVMGAILGAWH
jgi:biotin transporter BioY